MQGYQGLELKKEALRLARYNKDKAVHPAAGKYGGFFFSQPACGYLGLKPGWSGFLPAGTYLSGFSHLGTEATWTPESRGGLFEHLILDVLNELAVVGQHASLAEDILEKTDLMVKFKSVPQNPVARVQVALISNPELHEQKVGSLHAPNELVVLTPLELAKCAVHPPNTPAFEMVKHRAFWAPFDGGGSDEIKLAHQIYQLFEDTFGMPTTHPLGPMWILPPTLLSICVKQTFKPKMQPDPQPIPFKNQSASSVPPPLSPANNRKSGSGKNLSFLLSVCLGLFLVDAAVSFIDDSLILLCGSHGFSFIRELTSVLEFIMSAGVFALMALTPMVPKRLFLPIPLFTLATILAVFPFLIYCFGQLQQIDLGFSIFQVILGLALLRCSQGSLKFSWPLVPENRLGSRGFSWVNLSAFVLVTIFGLVPALLIYLLLCASMAVNHFSEGFMALRPGGFTVEVRKYVRNDGKMIELFPMAHVADAGFYRQVSRTFPSNSIILMEGVTDKDNLLTNKLSYKRMAKTLGLSEQRQEFTPNQGKWVRADVDVDQFTPETIGILNLVTLIHAKGLQPEIIQKLRQYSPSPEMEAGLLDDLVRKRNQHLLEEIQSHILLSDNIMVPWGVAHMPGIAKEIQKLGFQLSDTHEYTVIRFGGSGNQSKVVKP